MRLFFVEDSAFCFLSIIDGVIKQQFDSNVPAKVHNNHKKNDSELSLKLERIVNENPIYKKNYSQTFIFNNSFKLDHVILALGDELCTAFGLSMDETRVIQLLNLIENHLFTGKKTKVSKDSELNELQNLVRDLKQTIKSSYSDLPGKTKTN